VRVFFRLFILLEDECHALDIHTYIWGSTKLSSMQRERSEKARLEGEQKWYYQVLSCLVLKSASPTTVPSSLASKYRKGLTRREGPFVRNLVAALTSF
jgi:hypothetical protein